MNARAAIIWLVSCSLALPSPSFAQNRAPSRIPLAVGDVKLPEELVSQRSAVRTAMSNAFAREDRVQLIPDTDVGRWKQEHGAAPAAENRSKKLAEARELLSRGKKAYDSLDLKKALRILEEARRQFILNLNELRSNRDLIDAHLYLGLTYAASNQTGKAAEEFKRLVYLDPKRELSTRNHSPKVVALFTKVKRGIMAEDAVRVRIESSPSEAGIYLNGKPSGTTPLELILQPGEYFVLAERSGTLPWYQPVELTRRTQNLRIVLRPSDREVAFAQLLRVRETDEDRHSEDLEELSAFAQGVGAGIVFLGEIRKETGYRLYGQLYDVRTRDVSKVVYMELDPNLADFSDGAKDVADALMTLIRPDGYVAPMKEPDLSLPKGGLTVGAADRPKDENLSAPPPEKPWYERWWIWPLVAAVGVGAFFGARSLMQSSQSGKIVIDNRGNF